MEQQKYNYQAHFNALCHEHLIITRPQYESISQTELCFAICAAIRSGSNSVHPVLSGVEILDAFVLRYKGQSCKSKWTPVRNSQGKGTGKGQSHPPWRYLIHVALGDMVHWPVGLHHLRGLLKSEGFCDSENMQRLFQQETTAKKPNS